MHLNKALILSLACFIFSSALNAAAPSGDSIGRVIITTTNLVAKQTDGSVRALRNASRIYQGDTLITGNDGMAQLRLYDGSVFSLRKNTEFKIAEYSFKLEQEPEERGLFNLIRGGFRTITGLLGKRPNSSYKVTTAAATIGIRGTHYGLRLCQNGDCKDEGISQDGLYGSVVDGEIVAENKLGNHSFSNDEYFFVAGWDSQPRGMLAPPGVVFGADKTGGKVKNKKKVDADNKSAANSTPEARQRVGRQIRKMIHDNRQQGENLNASNLLTPAPAGSVGFISMLQECCGSNVSASMPMLKPDPSTPVSAGGSLMLLRPNRSLGAAAWDNPSTGPDYYFQAQPNAQLKDVGSRSSLRVSWGRWANHWTAYDGAAATALPNASAHYIMSNNVTSATDITARGVGPNPTGTFNYVAGTRPTDHAGNVGKINSLTFNVNFTSELISGFNLDVSFLNGTENTLMQAASGNFLEAANGTLNITGTCTGGRCTAGVAMVGKTSINFLGSNSNAAMLSFYAKESITTSTIGYTGTALVSE